MNKYDSYYNHIRNSSSLSKINPYDNVNRSNSCNTFITYKDVYLLTSNRVNFHEFVDKLEKQIIKYEYNSISEILQKSSDVQHITQSAYNAYETCNSSDVFIHIVDEMQYYNINMRHNNRIERAMIIKNRISYSNNELHNRSSYQESNDEQTKRRNKLLLLIP
jgi:hypothetical protein